MAALRIRSWVSLVGCIGACTLSAAEAHAGPFDLAATGSRDRDRYGRLLRLVTRRGRSLGEELVAEGLAETWKGRRSSWCGVALPG